MKFLDDIKNQPQHVREIMFGLSVFITVLLVGMVWFRSFQKNLYVLLNPEDGLEKALAVENAPVPSLFGFIWQTAGDLKGTISNLFSDNANTANERANDTNKVDSGKVYALPLSERK